MSSIGSLQANDVVGWFTEAAPVIGFDPVTPSSDRVRWHAAKHPGVGAHLSFSGKTRTEGKASREYSISARVLYCTNCGDLKLCEPKARLPASSTKAEDQKGNNDNTGIVTGDGVMVHETGTSGLAVWKPVQPPKLLVEDDMMFSALKAKITADGVFPDWNCMKYKAQTPFAHPPSKVRTMLW